MEKVEDISLPRGVFVVSRKDMISDQLSWDDTDPSKTRDFSIYAWWICTDDGQDPEGFNTLKEVDEYLEKFRI